MRRTWYFVEQRGVCCLMLNPGCCKRGGKMQLDTPYAADFATFEHIIPKCRTKDRTHQRGATVLLACRTCNAEKGAKDPPEELIVRAEQMHEAWRVFTRTEDGANAWQGAHGREEVRRRLLAQHQAAQAMGR